jgi:very-short-patch-repair endonuclease
MSDECPHCEATSASSRAKRRVYVEANGQSDDTQPSGRGSAQKGKRQGQRKAAVDAGHGVQHSGRRRNEKAAVSKLSASQLRKMRKCEQRYARGLRQTATQAEKVFASFLRRTGIRYDFQKPVEIADHFYIVDFYLWEYATVVEIDGGYHEVADQKAKDADRTRDLALKREYSRLLRITNEEVLTWNDDQRREWLARHIFPWFFKEGDAK